MMLGTNFDIGHRAIKVYYGKVEMPHQIGQEHAYENPISHRQISFNRS